MSGKCTRVHDNQICVGNSEKKKWEKKVERIDVVNEEEEEEKDDDEEEDEEDQVEDEEGESSVGDRASDQDDEEIIGDRIKRKVPRVESEESEDLDN